MKIIGELLSVLRRPRAFPIKGYKPLDDAEREWLKSTIQHPIFQRVLDNVYAKKPPTNAPKTGCFQPDQLSANNRLHQIQGWEMYEAALFSQAEPINQVKQQHIPETYPDAGNRIGD